MKSEHISETGCTIHDATGALKHRCKVHRVTCPCGAEFEAVGTYVRQGKVRSCGCMSTRSKRYKKREKNALRESLSRQLWAMRLWVRAG
ncbi:MAG: hypothetical protein Tp138OMZ00d2C19078241_49 [Prokaryotic dsDNA virus sp.]|jgi:hypothetical protein|nr:MAG: hypothetical protein Tp138OMZ00d2C19078241_49 [Prokaryotic dsDNA virus sp.]